jgi:hypothetical protein
MPRTISALAAVLATLTIAAPPAAARLADDPLGASSRAGATSAAGEDAAQYPTPSDIARALAQERYYDPSARDAARPKTPSDITAALDQERYYSSYGDPEPLTPKPRAPEIRTDDRIAPLPFALAVLVALVVGLAAGSGLQLLRARRRHATGLAT